MSESIEQDLSMASSLSNEEKSSKRKVDDVAVTEETKKKKNKHKKNKDKARECEFDGIVNAIATHEAKTVQAWKQVVADLDKAGITVCENDVRDGKLVWIWDDEVYISLKMVLFRDANTQEWTQRYDVYCLLGADSKTKVFGSDEWDQLVAHLCASQQKASNKANRIRILDYLETETNRWTELMDAIEESEDVPPCSGHSIDDGLITLEWERKDEGFQVTVERRTQAYENGDIYESFCVQKSPLKQNDVSIVKSTKYFDSVDDVLERVVALLK